MKHVSRTIGYDARALTMDGQRQMLWSGAIHYPRSTPGMWPALMQRSKSAGLNAIETYVFWNLHERKRGQYDFSDRLDLRQFCTVAQQHGLDVILRIGPYICAEINYGGLPAWLRDVPGIRMRTWNKPFMQAMARWVQDIGDYMRPLLATHGGPIIAAQIENEYGMIAKDYGAAGQRYLRWCIELGQSLNFGVPWIMCFGGMPGALETINRFYGHEGIAEHRQTHADQPLLWTENWTGWYDVWSTPHKRRTAEDEAYAVARFIAGGGTGVNYYMWHGGTNFGREGMYLQTSSYDYDAPLDEYGLPTDKSEHIARLHRAIAPFTQTILQSDGPQVLKLGRNQAAYTYAGKQKSISFVCNDAAQPASVTFNGHVFELPAKSALLLDGTRELYHSAHLKTARGKAKAPQAAVASPRLRWQMWAEPLPDQRHDAPIVAAQPIEQLKLTEDHTDYCWYSTTVRVKTAGAHVLTLTRAADFVYVFVDGLSESVSDLPLLEDRGDITGDAYQQQHELYLEAGERRLDILCVAMGLIKGDWQIGNRNMAGERKGLWGPVLLDGKKLVGWEMRPGLVGEVPETLGVERGASEMWQAGNDASPRWYRTHFARPDGLVAGESALMLDVGALHKGMIWLNGRCLARFWQNTEFGPNAPFINDSPLLDVDADRPAQTVYHLPVDWLRADNELMLFAEAGGAVDFVHLLRRA